MKPVQGLLAVFSAEALAAASWILFTPSERSSAIALGMSRDRILLFCLALILLIALLAATLAAWRWPARLASLEARLDRLCIDEQQLPALLLFLVLIPAAFLSGSLAVALGPAQYASVRSWAPDTFPLLHSFVIATLPLHALGAALALESAGYLGIHYRPELRASFSWRRLVPPLLVLGITLITLFHWILLAFQLRFFKNNPAWYWKLAAVPFGSGDLLFLLGAVLLIVLAYWLLVIQPRPLPGLIVLFLLGIFLQFGVALMSGGSFASFQDRYLSTYHKTYIAKAASSSASLLQTVQQYEQLYGARSFTETKPPGLMVFYTALDHIVNGYPLPYSSDLRYERLAAVVSVGFPVLATTLLVALYGFARRYIPGPCGFLPALASFLLVLSPNLVLFSLFPDQAVYPLVFLLGVLFVVVTVRRQSLLLALLLGMFLYVAVFFAFTMLPLYPVAGLYLALHYWSGRRALRLSRSIWLVAVMGLGTVLLYFLFRLLLGYDFFPRFAQTMTINHDFDFYLRVGKHLPAGSESLSTRLAQIAGAAWLNNLDFGAAVGFAIYILFWVQGLRLLLRLFRGSASPPDLVLAALLLSFLLLNLAGTAQGEVPRLWLFWLPMVVILAALEIERLVQQRPWVMLLLAGVQLATIFLTFHFQDLRM